jgi:hypothetical protein
MTPEQRERLIDKILSEYDEATLFTEILKLDFEGIFIKELSKKTDAELLEIIL